MIFLFRIWGHDLRSLPHRPAMTDPLQSHPLIRAVAHCDYDSARVLLAKGADPNVCCPHDDNTFGGATPLMFALGCFDGWVLDERSPRRPLDTGFLTLLFKSGANPDVRNCHGKTALHLTLADPDHRSFLLKNGANPNIGDELAMTPLHFAAGFGDASLCEQLHRHGANLEQTDKYGFTALLTAARTANAEAVARLIRLGANPQARLPDGTTALHLAAGALQTTRRVVTLEALHQAGLSVDVETNEHFRPLHQAAASNHVDAIRWLLCHGADKSARCANGRNALEIARLYQHDESARLLIG